MNYKKFLAAASAALMIVIVITLVLVPGAWAQSKYKTLHTFKGGKDGASPQASVTFDAAGNLYGTTYGGGSGGSCLYDSCGVVFELTSNSDGGWKEKVLYAFTGGNDGDLPSAGLILGQKGNLYGTTIYGGNFACSEDGCGVVFKLTPNLDGSWTESVLHAFNGTDGSLPQASLIFDKAGNLYGTTSVGGNTSACFNGAYGCGTVFKLTPNADGSWTESVLYSFCSLTNCSDGVYAGAGNLIFDKAGNLYGATSGGGAYGGGMVFKLTPGSGGTWTESVLYSFCSDRAKCTDGSGPNASLIFDAVGNLYGTASYGWTRHCGDRNRNCGVVFQLIPNPDGSWTQNVLHRFEYVKNGSFPNAGLVFDHAGNLYGTTQAGGSSNCGNYGCGVVFKLTPNSNGGWKETVLQRFADHPGSYPAAGLIFDAAGNLYGTTHGDGSTTFGTVFEITP